MLERVLIVGIGGFVGANTRFLLGAWLAERLGASFPWATFVINVTGSLAIGFLLTFVTERVEVDPRWRLLFVTGFLGAYTTFSTFSLDTALLYERGELGLAALYVVVSVALSIGGLFAGLALVRHFS